MEIAFFGQTSTHGRARHPRHVLVVKNSLSGHELHANLIIFTNGALYILLLTVSSVIPVERAACSLIFLSGRPIASLIRSPTIALSKNILSLCVAISPGIIW